MKQTLKEMMVEEAKREKERERKLAEELLWLEFVYMCAFDPEDEAGDR